jgi:hypothetical protein
VSKLVNQYIWRCLTHSLKVQLTPYTFFRRWNELEWTLTFDNSVLDLLLKPSEIFQKVKGEPFFPLSNFLIASNCLSDMYVGVLSSSSSTYFYQHLQYLDKLFCARDVVYICSWNVTDFCPTFLPTSQRSVRLILPTLCAKMQMCQHRVLRLVVTSCFNYLPHAISNLNRKISIENAL